MIFLNRSVKLKENIKNANISTKCTKINRKERNLKGFVSIKAIALIFMICYKTYSESLLFFIDMTSGHTSILNSSSKLKGF